MRRSVIIILSALLAISVLLNAYLATTERGSATSDTTTCAYISYDTIPYFLPVARDSTVVRYVVKELPVSRRDTASNRQDTACVAIPITQKTYGDSTYTAWVSGYEARLDSIKTYQQTKTICNTVAARRKMPPWGIGVTAGYGIGQGGLTPYIGVGVTYRLFSIGGGK